MNQIALPVASAPSRSRWTLWLVLPVIALMALGTLWAFTGSRQAGPVAAQSMLYTIVPMDFPIKVNKDGELQATNNIEIVSQVEAKLSNIAQAETEIKRSLERAARLRQAILKRAFEGRLV